MSKKQDGHSEVLNFAKSQLGDLITGVHSIGTLDGIACYEPVFADDFDNPGSATGLPFFILLENGKCRISTIEEYLKFESLF